MYRRQTITYKDGPRTERVKHNDGKPGMWQIDWYIEQYGLIYQWHAVNLLMLHHTKQVRTPLLLFKLGKLKLFSSCHGYQF